jgi:hypothetical protein
VWGSACVRNFTFNKNQSNSNKIRIPDISTCTGALSIAPNSLDKIVLEIPDAARHLLALFRRDFSPPALVRS